MHHTSESLAASAPGSAQTDRVAYAVVFATGTALATVIGVLFGSISLIALLGVVGLTTAVCLICYRPWLAAYAILATAPLIAYRHDLLNFNFTLQRTFIFIGAAAVLVRMAAARRLGVMRAPILFWIPVYLGIKVLDLARTQKPEYAVRQIAIIGFGLLIVWIMTETLRSARRVHAACLALALSSTVPVGLGVEQFIVFVSGGRPTLPLQHYLTPLEPDDPRLSSAFAASSGEWGDAIRPAGTLGGAVAFGEYVSTVFCLVLGVVITSRGRRRAGLAVALYLVVLAALIVTSFSRSAWISAAVGVASVLFIVNTRRQIRVRWGWVITSVISVIGGTLIIRSFYPDALNYNFFTMFDTTTTRVSEHLELRIAAMKLFLASPLIGVGLGNYGTLTGQGGLLSSAHAALATELAEGGVLGSTALAMICLSVWLPLLREIRAGHGSTLLPWAVGLFGGITTLCFNNIVLYDTLFRDTSWPLLGLGAVMVLELRRQRRALPVSGVATAPVAR